LHSCSQRYLVLQLTAFLFTAYLVPQLTAIGTRLRTSENHPPQLSSDHLLYVLVRSFTLFETCSCKFIFNGLKTLATGKGWICVFITYILLNSLFSRRGMRRHDAHHACIETHTLACMRGRAFAHTHTQHIPTHRHTHTHRHTDTHTGTHRHIHVHIHTLAS